MRFFLPLLFIVSMPISGQTLPERKALPSDELRALAAVYGVLLDSYVAPLDGADAIKASIQGMLRELDPDGGEYWSEQEMQDFRSGPPPGSGSIGSELWRRDGALILSPLAAGPASQAGLKFGDQLRTVDGTAVATNTVTRVLRLLRGPVGTDVSLGVYRPRDDKSVTITVKRGVVASPSPSLSALPDNLQLLRVPTLSPDQLSAAFRLLRDSWLNAKFSGLVLDLRGNQGGVVESAVALAAAFLPRDTVIASMTGRGPNNNRTFRANPSDYERGIIENPLVVLPEDLRKLPLVVLVDGQTASGAEIVVAALRDARRARIAGRPTLGRGSIQTVTPIPGAGAIKYTSGHWVSPAGTSFDRSPIQPDHVVESLDDDANFLAATSLMREMRGLSEK